MLASPGAVTTIFLLISLAGYRNGSSKQPDAGGIESSFSALSTFFQYLCPCQCLVVLIFQMLRADLDIPYFQFGCLVLILVQIGFISSFKSP